MNKLGSISALKKELARQIPAKTEITSVGNGECVVYGPEVLNLVFDLENAARGLREAQKAYMADRGNDELGKMVAAKAKILDAVLETC